MCCGGLQDYSKNSYDVTWSQDCWWDKAVIVYGDSKLKRDHPVVAFLANDKHAKSLAIYKEGCVHHCVGMPCCPKPITFPAPSPVD